MGLLELDDTFQQFLERQYLGNTYERWLVALAILVGTFLLLGIAKRLVQARLAHIAARTETDIDDLVIDLVKRTKRFFLFVIAFYVASHFVAWPGGDTNQDGTPDTTTLVETYIQHALKVAFWIQVGFWGRGLVLFGIGRLVKGKSADDPARTMGVTVLGFIGHLVVWSLVLLLCLEALGQNVTSLIASLGVGGIAVALALQNVLGDLFASITILLDKPFVVGDGVVVGDFNGTVERIGVKTTRLRSVNGEEIIMGNNDLVSSRIRNFKRLNERRVVLALGIVYETPVDTVERIPSILREIVTATPDARFERAHFKGFGDSALQFEMAYFALKQEYGAMMDIQQAINLAILRRFEAEKIEFAFPTQTVRHVNQGSMPVALDLRGTLASVTQRDASRA